MGVIIAHSQKPWPASSSQLVDITQARSFGVGVDEHAAKRDNGVPEQRLICGRSAFANSWAISPRVGLEDVTLGGRRLLGEEFWPPSDDSVQARWDRWIVSTAQLSPTFTQGGLVTLAGWPKVAAVVGGEHFGLSNREDEKSLKRLHILGILMSPECILLDKIILPVKSITNMLTFESDDDIEFSRKILGAQKSNVLANIFELGKVDPKILPFGRVNSHRAISVRRAAPLSVRRER
ncbi:hypothetical protein BKA70DRAFT_1220040 [Coprinopsis sp. MPI-PUGE-AT-0042]|nr:hypothetical protein BKA70DRAFT_1220040 [Coprinopsis sp. MPI-PUGE-AT-0042]